MIEQRENTATSRNERQVPWLLSFAATALLTIGLSVIAFAVWGFSTGALDASWGNLSEGQGAVVGQLLTVYAAAFAAVFVPLVFRGQINDLKGQISEASAEIRSLAEESKLSFRILNEYALQQAGIRAEY
jgi:hypothetical protein